ncbi:MAG: amidohydrolase family protein [Gemmatimonadaceae bacterium]
MLTSSRRARRRFMRAAVSTATAVTVLVAARLAGQASRPDPPRVVAFEGVTVVPMDRERVLERQTVVVRDGRIARIGPSGAVRVPAGAIRVDGRGRYLMPGLADMHVHPYNTDQFVNYLAHGVTTIAVLNGSRYSLRWREQVANGTLLGPTIYTAGPSLEGVPAGNPQFLSTATPDDGRRAVQAIAAAGYDLIKVYMTLTPETYAAILAEAKAQRLVVAGHIPPQVGVDGVLRSGGQGMVAHAEEFFRERVDSAHRAARTAEIVRGVKAAGITVIPNMSAYADYIRSIKDLNEALADPEMRYASPAVYSEKLPSHNRSIRPNPQQFLAGAERGLAMFRPFTKALSDAGVPLLLGTDAEFFGYVGASLHEELRQMVAAGLTPYQALSAGTAAAGDYVAASVRGAERFGRIAVGQRADLVLLGANPLESVANAERIEGVMTRGRWLPAERLRTLRDSLAERFAPLRAGVLCFDSLVAAGRIDDAATTLGELRRANPGSTPIAHIVMWVKAQRLLPTNPSGAVRLLEWNAEMYPETHAAHAELARGYLALGDTTRAMAAARRALAIFPTHAAARAIIERR